MIIKTLAKFTIEITLCLIILSYVSSIILVKGSPSHWKTLLAHTTGFGVQISMIITFFYSLLNFIPYHYRNKYSMYSLIVLILGILLMLFGYNLFIFEGLSPSLHAQVNIIFDFATILYSWSVLIDKIATKKYILEKGIKP